MNNSKTLYVKRNRKNKFFSKLKNKKAMMRKGPRIGNEIG